MHDVKATDQRPLPQRRAGSRVTREVSLIREEPLLTVREVARMLCVSRPTVYSMIRRGELRALYIRYMVRLVRREVQAYMRMHKAWVLRHRRKCKGR